MDTSIIEKLQFGENNHPTYTTVTEDKKTRRVRYFGAVRLINGDGKEEIKAEAGYYFIKNEPKTIYTQTKEAVINERTAKKNLLKKEKKNVVA